LKVWIEHIVEHELLLLQVVGYQDRIVANDGVTMDEILNFLAGWLLDHTLGLDQQYGPYLTRFTE